MERLHPRSVPAAYAEIGKVLAQFGYEWKQGSVYVGSDDNLATFFEVIGALKALPWFPIAVRDIRAFRAEQWSDITKIVKGPNW